MVTYFFALKTMFLKDANMSN